jgi:hypothetical protein
MLQAEPAVLEVMVQRLAYRVHLLPMQVAVVVAQKPLLEGLLALAVVVLVLHEPHIPQQEVAVQILAVGVVAVKIQIVPQAQAAPALSS